jgi:hypothetical protein
MVIKLLGKFVYFRQKITDVRSSFTESITVMQDAIKKVSLSQPTWAIKTTMGHCTHDICNSAQWATALMVHVTAHNGATALMVHVTAHIRRPFVAVLHSQKYWLSAVK